MRAVGVGVIVTALLAYLALCSYMALTLTKPERVPFTKSPEQYGLAYENVSFPSRIDRLTLDGWYLPPAPAPATDAPTQKRPVVVVHGKASDRQQVTRDHNGVAIAAHLVRQGHPVLLFDLRGSGRSAGVRFTLGAQEVRDVGGAVDFLESRGLTPNGVSLLSFSMGAATSLLYTPTDLRVRSLVEDSAYGALGDVLDDQIPKASGLPRFFTPGVILMARPLIGVDAYSIRPIDAVRQLGQRRTPLMVIHGDADQTVPFRHGQEIAAAYAAASGGPTPETYWVPGAEHVGSYEVDPATYLARITAFLSR
ncbi:MAG TPA: alpha/beta hydrolase [Chloroflexota bacterium]|nr:alpha/beta hydrolase [Chloroflexota bacterium]